MDKVKEIGLKIITLFLFIIGIVFLLLAQVMMLIGAVFYRLARNIMVKFSYDYLDLAWNNVVDDSADGMECCKKYLLTAKIEL